MHRSIKLAPLLLAFGCFGSNDSVLFAGDAPPNAGGQAAGGVSGAHSGTGSGSSAGTTVQQAGTATGGSAGSSPSGGNGSAGSGAETSGAGGQGAPVIVIEDCSVLQQAVANEAQDRCYRVNYQNLSFRDAQRACQEAGGNLVSIGSEAENEFVAELHDGEHWLGATDGRDDMTPGVGPYVWLNGEDWLYSNWEDGQPNAYETDCPLDQDDTDCFEHCAFQSDEGDWLDRSCWHTIVSVCEWELVKPETGEGGAGGEGGGGGVGGSP
jgi:hypothetical protein